jgi:hypothetical protein
MYGNKWLGIAFITLIVVTLISTAATAGRRGRRGRNMDPEKMVTAMQNRLSLTDKQADAVRPIIQNRTEQQKALIQSVKNGDIDREELRGKLEALQTETEKQLETVLSPEQMEQYRNFRKARRDRIRNRPRSRTEKIE